MLAEGSLTIGPGDTLDTLAAKLLPIPGIGPWTVGYVAMRVLGSSDIFLPGDAAVRNGYGLLRGDTLAQARSHQGRRAGRMAEPLRPWRSYATLHLWRAAVTFRVPKRSHPGPSSRALLEREAAGVTVFRSTLVTRSREQVICPATCHGLCGRLRPKVQVSGYCSF